MIKINSAKNSAPIKTKIKKTIKAIKIKLKTE